MTDVCFESKNRHQTANARCLRFRSKPFTTADIHQVDGRVRLVLIDDTDCSVNLLPDITDDVHVGARVSPGSLLASRIAPSLHPQPAHLFPGAPLQAGGSLLRREYAFVYRAGFLNKTGPVEVTLRDKLYNFAHLLTAAGNSEEIFRQ